jgi:hypothetical protein
MDTATELQIISTSKKQEGHPAPTEGEIATSLHKLGVQMAKECGADNITSIQDTLTNNTYPDRESDVVNTWAATIAVTRIPSSGTIENNIDLQVTRFELLQQEQQQTKEQLYRTLERVKAITQKARALSEGQKDSSDSSAFSFDADQESTTDPRVQQARNMGKKWHDEFGTKDIAGLRSAMKNIQETDPELARAAMKETLDLITADRLPIPANVFKLNKENKTELGILYKKTFAEERADLGKTLLDSFIRYKELHENSAQNS